MTRRDRLAAKAERRREWAGKAEARSGARFDAAHRLAHQIPFGQPILVGHHSERSARRDAERIDRDMTKGVEEYRLAEHHRGAAAGLEAQLERSVFTDDPDAVERLEERIREKEEKAERYAAINKAWRKGGADAVRASGLASEALCATMAETMRLCPWLGVPLDTGGLRAAIRRDKERIEQVRTAQERRERAEAAPSGVLVEGDAWVLVTFPEKPGPDVLDARRTWRTPRTATRWPSRSATAATSTSTH